MVTTGTARRWHLAFLLCTAILWWAGAPAAPMASAGPLETVTGQVDEAVGEPVGGIVETVTSPAEEVTETATAPVQEVTGAPPVNEVSEAATAPIEEVAKEAAPPVKAAVEAVSRPPPPPSLKAPGSTVTPPKAAGVTRVPKEAVEAVGGTARPAPGSSQAVVPDPGAQPAGGADGAPGRDPLAPPGSDRTTSPRGDVFVPSPTRTGATSAPLPRWVAYIWPAVALAQPQLARLLERSVSSLRAALLGSATLGPAPQGGVAGVHASGGRPGLAESSPRSADSASSPLSKITSDIGHFPYNLSGAALGYIAIVAIMLIGLFIAVRWEIANGRRDGRG
jgi:hypothetical protein